MNPVPFLWLAAVVGFLLLEASTFSMTSVWFAVGAAAEIVIATSKSPLTLNILNKSNIQTGIKTSLKNETKYNSFFLIRFLKFEFARNVPNTIIASGELQLLIICKGYSIT